jgi:DNA-binding HxlR family transcriptional regulator
MVESDPPEATPPVNEDRKSVPVTAMVESIVGCKWSVRLLSLLADGCTRPSALLRNCPGLSAKVMNERLRKLTRFGIARRTVFGDKPPIEVEYVLTAFGQRFMGILDEVRHLQDALDQGGIEETDPGREEPIRSHRVARRRT